MDDELKSNLKQAVTRIADHLVSQERPGKSARMTNGEYDLSIGAYELAGAFGSWMKGKADKRESS